MKKIYFFLALCLMGMMSMPAYSVIRSFTIYDGTEVNDWVPMAFNHCNDWTESEFIVPASLLTEMVGKQITGVQFYVTGSQWYKTNVSMDLIMWEVPASTTTLNSLKYPSSGQSIAGYSGQIQLMYQPDPKGHIIIEFETPLEYNGGSLVFNARNPSPGRRDDITYYGQRVNGASVAGYNAEVGSVVFVDQQNFVPKMTFFYEYDGKDYVALLSEDEKELTLYYVSNPEELKRQHQTGWAYVGEEWMNFFNTTGQNVQYGDPFQVEKIIIDRSVRDARPQYMYWFHDFEYVTEIVGLENINTSDVFSMAAAFDGFGVEVIDLRTWDFSKVTITSGMFKGVSARTILCNVDLSAMDQITDSQYMFYGDSRYMVLAGGNGTPWDANHIDKSYARPDKPGQPGYFTARGLDIEQVPSDQVPSTKVIENGVLYFMYNGTKYNVQGIECTK